MKIVFNNKNTILAIAPSMFIETAFQRETGTLM